MEEKTKMKKTIITTIAIMFAITFVTATTILSGTNHTLEFSGLVSDCYILNNQSNLEGLNFIENGSNVIISTDKRYKPDNFTMSCLVQGQREESSGSSGGGSAAPEGWSSKCGYNKKCLYGKTNVTSNITIEPIIPEEEVIEDTTEPVIQEEKETPGWLKGLGVILVILILSLIGYKLLKKSPDEINDNNQKGGTKV